MLKRWRYNISDNNNTKVNHKINMIDAYKINYVSLRKIHSYNDNSYVKHYMNQFLLLSFEREVVNRKCATYT
jgi:hypothetical protein